MPQPHQDDDVRRRVPRTDAVLVDPLLAEAVSRLGRHVVRAAVSAAQDLVRAGQIAPEDVAGVAASSLPPLATSMTPAVVAGADPAASAQVQMLLERVRRWRGH